jgi:hypothetical protein
MERLTAPGGRPEGRSSTAATGDGAGRPAGDEALTNLVGASPAFLATVHLIRRISRCDATVMVQGETGTGKKLAARAIHYPGSRRDAPFVPLNCGAIPESLVESELFGYARGAFTDARESRQGVIAQAEGRTLFLDEIEAMGARGQVALLRFLQDHEYRPVASSPGLPTHTTEIAARILAHSSSADQPDHPMAAPRPWTVPTMPLKGAVRLTALPVGPIPLPPHHPPPLPLRCRRTALPWDATRGRSARTPVTRTGCGILCAVAGLPRCCPCARTSEDHCWIPGMVCRQIAEERLEAQAVRHVSRDVIPLWHVLRTGARGTGRHASLHRCTGTHSRLETMKQP